MNTRDFIRKFMTDTLSDLSNELTLGYSYKEESLPMLVIQLEDEKSSFIDDEGSTPLMNKYSLNFSIFFISRLQFSSEQVKEMDEEINRWVDLIRWRILNVNVNSKTPFGTYSENGQNVLTYVINSWNLNSIIPVPAYEGNETWIKFSGTIDYNLAINI